MKIRATLLTLVFGVASCVPLAFGQEGTPKKKMNFDPAKPAGELFKNVKVLKDVPAGQFLQYMRSFNAALGKECTFCHVQDRSSDEKHEKVVARNMITMSHEINEKFFNGKMEVRCYTCHKGAEHPVSTPPEAAAGGEHKN
jgi:hypothetical protein